MAKKRKRRHLSAAATKTGLSRRGRKRSKRRKRRSGLSEGIPFIGKIGLDNPIIGGIAGGIGVMFLKGMIPTNIPGLTPKPSPSTSPTIKTGGVIRGMNDNSGIQPYIKGILLLVGSVVAKNMKQDMVSAGLAAGATILTMQQLGMLSDDNGMKKVRYANPNLLKDDISFYDNETGEFYALSPNDAMQLNEALLLAENYPNKSPYPMYDAQLLDQ